MIFAASHLDLTNQLDNDMFNHITYVTNRCLMIMKKEGVGKEQLEAMGKYLWRLFRVIQAYNEKKQQISLNQIINIVNDFRATFSGV